MSKPESKRIELIPFGNCVPEEGDNDEFLVFSDTFTHIDAGMQTPQKLEDARSCCSSCVQLNFCKTQRTEIATELWRRGAGKVVVGGEVVDIDRSADTNNDLCQPTIQFNINHIPSTPKRYMAMLRQAMRTDQIKPKDKHRDPSMQEYGEVFLREEQDFCASIGLAAPLLERSIATIVHSAILAKLAPKKPGQPTRPRVSVAAVEALDQATAYPLIKLFLSDVRIIERDGLHDPPTRAMHFSPAYYRALQFEYSDLPDAIVRRFIGQSRSPYMHLHRTRVHLHILTQRFHEANIPVSQSALVELALKPELPLMDNFELKRIARDSSRGIVTASHIKQLYTTSRKEPSGKSINREEYSDISPGVINHIERNHTNPEKRRAALERHRENMAAVTLLFGDHRHCQGKILERLVVAHPLSCVTAVREYLDRVATLSSHQSSLPENRILEYALRGISSIDIAERHEKIKKLTAQARHANLRPDPWLIQQLVDIYPENPFEPNKAIQRLLKKGICLVDTTPLIGTESTPIRQSLSLTRRDNKHVTFAGGLSELSPIDRIIIAASANVELLIYGQHFDSTALQKITGAYDIPRYASRVALIEAQRQLFASRQKIGQKSLSILELEDDLKAYDTAASSYQEIPPAHKERWRQRVDVELTTVVGNEIIHLSSRPSVNPARIPPNVIQAAVNHYPPPLQAEGAQALAWAAQQNIITIRSDETTGPIVAFSAETRAENSEEVLTELAHALRIDYALFGGDLTTTLKQRHGVDYHSIIAWHLSKLTPSSEKLHPLDEALRIITSQNMYLPSGHREYYTMFLKRHIAGDEGVPKLAHFQDIFQGHLLRLGSALEDYFYVEKRAPFEQYILRHLFGYKERGKIFLPKNRAELQKATAEKFKMNEGEFETHLDNGIIAFVEWLNRNW